MRMDSNACVSTWNDFYPSSKYPRSRRRKIIKLTRPEMYWKHRCICYGHTGRYGSLDSDPWSFRTVRMNDANITFEHHWCVPDMLQGISDFLGVRDCNNILMCCMWSRRIMIRLLIPVFQSMTFCIGYVLTWLHPTWFPHVRKLSCVRSLVQLKYVEILGLLINKVLHLSFDVCFAEVIRQGDLPSKLTHLKFSCDDTMTYAGTCSACTSVPTGSHCRFLDRPITPHDSYFHDDDNWEELLTYAPDIICRSLYNLPILAGVLPKTLVCLQFGWSYNVPVLAGVLPSSLLHLCFSAGFNQPMPENGVLPENLRYLKLYQKSWDSPSKFRELFTENQARFYDENPYGDEEAHDEWIAEQEWIDRHLFERLNY